MLQVDNALGELDPDLARYGWAVRRTWWIITAAAVLAGLCGALLVGGSSHTIEQRVALDGAHDVLSASGLADAFKDTPPTFQVRDFLNDPESIAGQPDDVAVTATLDPTTGDSVVLTVSAASKTTANAASAALIDSLDRWVGARRDASADALIAVLDEQRTAIADRLAVLDAEIDQLDDRDALRDAYLAERANLISASLQYDGQEQALSAFTASDRRLAITDSRSEASDSRVLWLIIGAILGLLAAVSTVLVWAHLDRMVRSRSDLARLFDGEVLPAIPRSGPERTTSQQIAQAAMRRLGDGRPRIVVPADPGSGQLANDLAALDGELSRVVTSEALLSADPDAAVFVAVKSGRTHADDVIRTMQYVDSVGLTCRGMVLGDVAPRNLRRAAV